MRRQVGIWRELVMLGIAFCVACDGSKPAPGVSETWDNVCVDMDKDGYGFQCEGGSDCDDANKAVHDDCSSCRTPREGCECEDGIEPIDCRLPYTMDTSGSLLCHTGTRYCRDGAWSGCEGVITFTVPPPARQLTSSSLIDPAAPAVLCNPKCDPGCYLIEDKLDTPFQPDASVGSNVAFGDAGGVTVRLLSPISTFPEVLDGTSCDPDAQPSDPDCDGLPAPYDSDALPSGGTHNVAFFDLAPNTARTKTFQAKTSVDALDVYLYPGTGSDTKPMLDELVGAFSSGSFLPDAAGLTCLDLDGDGMPDDANKTGGIAGNVSCLVRDVRFGAGWFRDIPFFGPIAATGQAVAPWDTEIFEHHHDISANRASVRAALAGFEERDSPNPPEAATQGLWSIATGSGFYAGWDRSGILPREDCPSTAFGYPCFRKEALPVVLLISPAPMQNGPMTSADADTDPKTPEACLEDATDTGSGIVCAPLEYPSDLLDNVRPGTEGRYRKLTASAETLTDPEPVGVIDDALVTYLGRIETLKADYTYANLSTQGCYAWSRDDDSGHDAIFSFQVQTSGKYVFSGRGSRFDNSLSVFRIPAAGAPEFVDCSDDVKPLVGELGEGTQTPELRLDLAPGDYVLVMKAWGNQYNQGEYQVTLGRSSLEEPTMRGSFEAKAWAGTNGVQEALTSRGVRVVTLQVGVDRYLKEQAEAVAKATGAIDGAGLALRGDLTTKTLGDEAVRVLRSIVNGTKYDVSLELPKSGTGVGENPGFVVAVEAIDPSTGCDGVRDGTDADSVPDYHLGCVASAKPQFRVTFSNPNAIPKNPADPMTGGYPMWMRVLGDGHVVLDQVRVYVVPELVYTPVTATKYNPTGTYEQEVRSNDCTPDELPTWGALTWKVGLPASTSIRFEACGSDTAQELSSCVPKELVTLTPGATGCTPGDACGDDGYCDVNGTCVQIQGASCVANEDCGAFGVCAGAVGAKHCANTVATLDTFPVSRATLQGKRFVRVVARLNSSPDSTQAPTLLQWSINYRCTPGG